jgi:hypothetical protein
LSSGIDAFTFDWSVDNNWLQLACSSCIFDRSNDKTLVCQKNSAIVSIVKDYKEYETLFRFFVRGSADNSVFSENKFISNVLVLYLDARY